ncbi:MAG TPA: hypothetical protein VMA31_08070 [Bryobacteraceae bacterium]|nr:hypothetical protein [Bryobacteraceae bacterium]
MKNLGCIVKLVMIVVVLFFVLWLYTTGIRFFVQTYWWMYP